MKKNKVVIVSKNDILALRENLRKKFKREYLE